ncbi:MAG: MiaB/RimO family radical SAM methylthiotransferase [Bacteroides sp.]|nr:MiaB/RimO family radical SAM methylthiotransferase [Prevotella sp.]MCM1407386.1 MiaB/RimO family radical SAM methylthiotransferase [Treponema brennaborense]MCM1469876.1 MiaB/RimO family radical SAM methylthiotransferase [Bacteroides sp.]
MTRTFFLDQHGCAKNQVDGELIIAEMENAGWVRVDDAAAASLIIVNSCGFIEQAKKESIDSLLSARKTYPAAKIMLTGCLVQRYGSVFLESLPEADGFFGNGNISELKNALASVEQGNRTAVLPAQRGVCEGQRTELLNLPGSAYVKITEGCDNCCSFCAIPQIRGRLRSRAPARIIEEIQELLERGIYEINLVGQDLAAYGCEESFAGFENEDISVAHYAAETSGAVYENGASPLSLLLKRISDLRGSFWIRMLYIHPDHFPRDILPILKNDGRILPYFDIPFQSGDDDIIRAMNRRGSAAGYLLLAEFLRQELGDIALRTTFLAGFPGETSAAAENTAKFLKALRPNWSGCFVYSKEDGTPAAELKKQINKRTAKKRAAVLEEMQTALTEELLKARVGKIYDVLIEELIPDPEKKEGIAVGRAWFQAPEVDGAVVVSYDADDEQQSNAVQAGKTVAVRITSVSGVDIHGVPAL